MSASPVEAGVVGPVVTMNVQIEGVTISAMIDAGAQSTIISRSTLHNVVRHLRSSGQDVPRLETPSVRIWKRRSEKRKGACCHCPSNIGGECERCVCSCTYVGSTW